MQELRKTIVPSAAAHKLDRLMQAVRYYQQQTKRKVSILAVAPASSDCDSLCGSFTAGKDAATVMLQHYGICWLGLISCVAIYDCVLASCARLPCSTGPQPPDQSYRS